MNTFEGKLIAGDIRIGIVAARFNEFITTRLLGGAEDALLRHGVTAEQIDVAWVPGAFEIPLIAQKMAESGKYDAVITLGAVIRGSSGIGGQVAEVFRPELLQQRVHLFRNLFILRVRVPEVQGDILPAGVRRGFLIVLLPVGIFEPFPEFVHAFHPFQPIRFPSASRSSLKRAAHSSTYSLYSGVPAIFLSAPKTLARSP